MRVPKKLFLLHDIMNKIHISKFKTFVSISVQRNVIKVEQN